MGEAQNQFGNLQAIKKATYDDSGASEDVHYHLFYEEVPKEFEKYAETELNETAENAKKGMLKLKKFLQDKKLPDVDDPTLRTLLRTCKYDLKKSVAKLEKFLRIRNTILEKVAKLDLKKVEYILEDKAFAFLPYRDKFGRAILYTQFSVRLDLYDVDDAFFCFLAFVLYVMNLPMASLFGGVYIPLCKTPSLSLMYRIVTSLKNCGRIMFDVPVRQRGVHVVYENFLIRWFVNIMRPIVPSKIYQRISFHGENLKGLQEVFHPDILPEELGGNMGPVSTKFYREEFINFIKKLKAEHHRKATQ